MLLLLDHVPTGQLTHLPPELIVPAAQLEHSDAPAAEDMPVGQGVHADGLAAPVLGWDVPAGHWLQLLFPACDQVPVGQAVHRKPVLEVASVCGKKPAAQVHPVSLAPGDDVLSVGHWLQVASPEIEKRLAPHCVHDVEPCPATDPPGQRWQKLTLVAPNVAEYRPALHGEQLLRLVPADSK